MGISWHAVVEILKKYSASGLVKDRPGRGRKRKISEEDRKKIVKKAKKDKDSPEIAREFAAETGGDYRQREHHPENHQRGQTGLLSEGAS